MFTKNKDISYYISEYKPHPWIDFVKLNHF